MSTNRLIFTGIVMSLIPLVKLQAPTIQLETKKPFECNSQLKLRCIPTTCCVSINRFWWKDTTRIINSGISTDPSKYNETVGTSYLTFTILGLTESDFKSRYRCSYDSLDSDYVTLNASDYFCPPCWGCGGLCIAFSLVGFFIAVGIGFFMCKCIDPLKKKAIMITAVGGGIGLVVDIVVTVLVGGLSCLCEKGYGYTCIFIGFGGTIIVVIVVVPVFYMLSKGQTRSNPPRGGYGTPSAEENML